MMLKRLVSLRENKDLTQLELSKIIGVSRVSISRWENGIEIIPMRKAMTIIKYFDTNLDYLFGLSDDRNKKYSNSFDSNISGDRISNFRREFKLSLRKLAVILNTSSSTISSYEAGKTIILSAFAYQIAVKYNISIDWLLGFSDEMYILSNEKVSS